jgi:hypothetical protein
MNIKTATLLKDEGFENVFVIDAPEYMSFILVSKTGGFGQNSGDNMLSFPTIQVMVADKDYQAAGVTIQAIKKFFMGLDYKDILAVLEDGGELVGYRLQSDTIDLGKDEQLRYRVSVNFTLYHNN